MSWEESFGRPPDIPDLLQFRHGVFFVRASDIAGQLYCEMKAHNSFFLGRVESEISSFKSAFGEHVKSVKWKYIVNELILKASVYNMFLNGIKF